jgi:hypothetical protein
MLILNENRLNYKVVDLEEIYNFRIKFISIRVHIEKLRFFEDMSAPYRGWEGSVVSNDNIGIVLQNFARDIYVCEFGK